MRPGQSFITHIHTYCRHLAHFTHQSFLFHCNTHRNTSSTVFQYIFTHTVLVHKHKLSFFFLSCNTHTHTHIEIETCIQTFSHSCCKEHQEYLHPHTHGKHTQFPSVACASIVPTCPSYDAPAVPMGSVERGFFPYAHR